MASSSTTSGGIPSPPPPTPSTKPLPSSAAAADHALSAFLHRLLLSSPPPLQRPPPPHSRSHSRPTPPPPVVSLLSPDHGLLLPAAAADLGYFHLAGHGVPSHLPSAALAELSVLDASARRGSNISALGFSEDEQETADADDPALVLDVDGGAADALPAATEYARRLRAVGMEVASVLCGCPDAGFGEGRRKARCLLWVSKFAGGEGAEAPPPAAGRAPKAYPYVVGLHCQWEAKGREAAPSWVVGDDGEWTAVGCRDGALLVTVGDIAQVWSNGQYKKVRGRPHPAFAAQDGLGESDRLSVTVLITLSLDSVVSPMLPFLATEEDDCGEGNCTGDGGDRWRFHSFSLEEYAWRVYHERLQSKDPLARYRA